MQVAGTAPSGIDTVRSVQSSVADSNGMVSFKFPVIPQGSRAVVTVNVPAAPPLTAMSAGVGLGAAVFQPLINWAGPTTVGPLTIESGETLALTGTGLKPGTTYQAIALGKQGPTDQLVPEVPLGSLSVQSTLYGPGATAPFSTQVDFNGAGPHSRLAIQTPGPGHATRLHYLFIMGIMTTSVTHNLTVSVRPPPFDGSTDLQIFSALITGVIATPAPWIPVPIGYTTPEDSQVIYDVPNEAAGETAHVTITLLSSLDH